ncbi:MAG: hypothetical protein NTV46_09135 [Verrucomicrobia bacterium]|nr:hypothetical protein [Verrucomicrobiota bacterium]
MQRAKSAPPHGRAAADNADEIAALSLWREFVPGALTAGHHAPSLRDGFKSTTERLHDGQSAPALDDLGKKRTSAPWLLVIWIRYQYL